ncbi:MAG: TVP38/TMEM64 family protein [Desulfobulbus sp.]|nr:TVP38/TMEM64 family protein [Desulfobulbus sp.]
MNREKFFLLAFAALAILLFFLLDLDRFLTLESLKEHRQVLQQTANDAPQMSALVFMAIYIIQTALSLPGATILSLGAGVLFGSILGTVYAVVAATIGATLACLVSRYLLHDTVQRRFGARLEGINQELGERGFNYLLFLRLVPLFPFFLINLAAGLTRLPLRTFVLATMLGIIPGGFVYVNAGAGLAAINSLGDVASPRVLGSFALLGLFALVPVAWHKWSTRK